MMCIRFDGCAAALVARWVLRLACCSCSVSLAA